MSTEAGNLGAEGVGSSVESEDVNWDDSMNVRKGFGHFSDFFKDDMVSEGWRRKAKDEKYEKRSNRIHFYFFSFLISFSFFFLAAASLASHWSKVFSNSLRICRVCSECGPGSGIPGSRAANGLAAPGFEDAPEGDLGGNTLSGPGHRALGGEMANCSKATPNS